MEWQRHLHLARVEQAAGLAFGFHEPDVSASASRARLIWIGSMTSALAGFVAATVYTVF